MLSCETMNQHKIALMEKIKAQGFVAPDWRHKAALPLVSLEDFFTGNTDQYSIACNLEPHPGLNFFFDTLHQIRSQPDVQDVLVEIYEIEEAEEIDEKWPYVESIYILTSANKSKVENWNNILKADGPCEGFAHGTPNIAAELKEGCKVLQIMWD